MGQISEHGGCRCGQVRFRLTAAPVLTSACHCTGCQRMTASAFSLSVAIPEDGFTVTTGETVLGGPHGDIAHHHCGHCKSWLFSRWDGMGPLVNVRSTMLDSPRWTEPFVEMQTADKLPWVSLQTEHSFDRFPSPDGFEPLLQAYQRWATSPGPDPA